MQLRRFAVFAFALQAALVASSRLNAANEPPIVAFQALVTDNAGVTRREETYPLVAAYPDRIVDLADVDSVDALLKTHPAWRFAGIEPKGNVCSDIPVGIGKREPAPSGAVADIGKQRDLFLVILSTAAEIRRVANTPEAIPRQLPTTDGPPGPSTDPLEGARRTVADRLGGSSDDVVLRKFGEFDFDGDFQLESALVGSTSRASSSVDTSGVLLVTRSGPMALPTYVTPLRAGSQVMGVGDINGDGRPEIVVKTSRGARDFGVEIHAWRSRGRSIGPVFERRSYGCY